ncbi:MAG: hypothetical protein ACQETH_03615 [Candidatus Rifleibacteriota bacterium]
MISSSLTAAGSIRECNQDAVLVDRNFRFAVIVDGKGINGSQAAHLLANDILLKLKEDSYLYSAAEVKKRIFEVFRQSTEELEAKYAGSVAGTVFVWVHAGVVAMLYSGRCRVTSSATDVFQKVEGNEGLFYCEHSADVNKHYLLTSEGFAFSFAEEKLKRLVKCFMQDFSREKLQNYWAEAANIYDGDDRSLIFLTLDKTDIDAGKKRELELFTDIDRQFSFPVWLPLGLAGAMGVLGLFISRTFITILKKIVPSDRIKFFN